MTATIELKKILAFSNHLNRVERHDFEGNIEHDAIERAVQNAIQSHGGDNLPLLIGWNYPTSQSGDIFIAMMSAPTPYDALKVLNDHYRCISLFGEKIHIKTTNELILEIVFPWESSKNLFLQMVATARLQRLLFDLFCNSLSPIRIGNFPFCKSLLTFFEMSPELVKQDKSVSFYYHNSCFAITMPNSDKSSFNHYVRKLERKKAQSFITETDDIVAKTDQLFDLTSINNWKKDYFADKLGFTVRSYDRLLKSHNTSFACIFRRHVKERAMTSLLSGHTVSFVADELGYSERKSFERAFKSWTSMTATEYRNISLAFREEKVKHNIISDKTLPLFSEPSEHINEFSRPVAINLEDISTIVENEPALLAKALCYVSSTCDLFSLDTRNIVKHCIKQAGVASMSKRLLMDNPPSNARSTIKLYKEVWTHIMLTLKLILELQSSYKYFDINWNEIYLTGLFRNVGLLYLLNTNSDSFLSSLTTSEFNSLTFDEIDKLAIVKSGISLYSLNKLILMRWGCDEKILTYVTESSTVSTTSYNQINAVLSLVEKISLYARTENTSSLNQAIIATETYFKDNGIEGNIDKACISEILKSVRF